MVVEVQPAGQGAGPGGLGGVDPDVGPFDEQCAVEPFDLAVGLGPVGPGPLVPHAVRGAGRGPLPGPVAGPVVGQDPFDGDAVAGEPGDRPGPEGGCGVGLLVGQHLGVDQPGVVVQGAVDVAVADHRVGVLAHCGGQPAVAGACRSAVGAPPAAGRDLPQLLDVHVDQRPR